MPQKSLKSMHMKRNLLSGNFYFVWLLCATAFVQSAVAQISISVTYIDSVTVGIEFSGLEQLQQDQQILHYASAEFGEQIAQQPLGTASFALSPGGGIVRDTIGLSGKSSFDLDTLYLALAYSKFTADPVDVIARTHVFMANNKIPALPAELSVSIEDQAIDSIAVHIDNADQIAMQNVHEVQVWYGFSEDVDFSNSSATARFAPEEFLQQVVNGQFQKVFTDQRFVQDQTEVFCAMRVVSKWFIASDTLRSSVTLSRKAPENSMSLSVQSVSPHGMSLVLQNTEQYDSVVVYWSTSDQFITLFKTELPGIGAKAISPGASQAHISGLHQQTEYYIGVRGLQNRLWSEFSNESIASQTTASLLEPIKQAPVSTIISIDSARQLLETNSLEVSVHITEEQFPDFALELGVCVADTAYISAAPSMHGQCVVVSMDQQYQQAVVPLSFQPELGDSFYVTTRIREVDSTRWSDIVSQNQATFVAQSSIRSTITFGSGLDTASSFGGDVLVWVEQGATNIPATIDTLFRYSFSPDTFNGFISVADGFAFSVADPSDSFFIGFTIADSAVAQGYSTTDLCVYAVDSAGIRFLPGTTYDEQKQLLMVKIEPMKSRLYPLIDTVAPQLQLQFTPDDPLAQSTVFTDQFLLIDNTVNSYWQYRFSRPDGTFAELVDGYAASYQDTISVQIDPTRYVSRDGIVGEFELADFRSSVKKSTNRARKRFSDDQLPVTENEWVAMVIRGRYTQTDPLAVLGTTKENWNYDERYLRFFRWVNGQGEPGNRWLELNNSESFVNQFDLLPGRLFWVKSRDFVVLNQGASVSFTPGDVYELNVPGKSWVDFGLPFSYDIAGGEIARATGADSTKFAIYKWKNVNEGWQADLVYAPSAEGVSSAMTPIEGADVSDAYTVYNASDADVTLRIPARSISQTKTDGFLGKKSAPLPVVSIHPHVSGRQMATLQYRYTQRDNHILPLGPSLATPVEVALQIDPETNHPLQYIQNELQADSVGRFFLLLTNKSSKAQPVTLDFTYPEEFQLRLDGKVIPGSATYSLPAHKTLNKEVLFATPQAFAARQKNEIHFSAFQNTLSSAIVLQLQLPEGRHVVTASLYTLDGRRSFYIQIPVHSASAYIPVKPELARSVLILHLEVKGAGTHQKFIKTIPYGLY